VELFSILGSKYQQSLLIESRAIEVAYYQYLFDSARFIYLSQARKSIKLLDDRQYVLKHGYSSRIEGEDHKLEKLYQVDEW